MTDIQRVTATTNVVAAYATNHVLSVGELTALLEQVQAAFAGLGAKPEEETAKPIPAVSIKKSITPDYLISLEDGRRYKSLKRHLRTAHGMTPDEYRAKWGLPSTYPMVAPNVAARRSEVARSNGLGRKLVEAAPAPKKKASQSKSAPKATAKTAKRGKRM